MADAIAQAEPPLDGQRAPGSRAKEPAPIVLMAVVPLFLLGLLLGRLSAYGIWDPAELDAADVARRWLEGETLPAGEAPLTSWLIGLGFQWFGQSEWAGRVPLALSGVLALAVGGHWVRSLSDIRTGLYALLIAGTTPLLLFQSRQMLGEAPLLAASTLVMLCASSAVYGATSWRVPWLVGTLASTVVAVLAGGALLGAVPPLCAVALAGLLVPPSPGRARAVWLALAALASGVVLLVVRDIWADTADYSPWVGGTPLGDAPSTFDAGLEMIFHAFLPWSGLLPVALGAVLMARPPDEREHDGADAETVLRVQVVLWAALAYAAHALYSSRYGHATFGAPLALGAGVALLLRDVERDAPRWWPAALIAMLFTGLLIRDVALYPASPIAGLDTGEIEVPEAFNPRSTWAAGLGALAACIAFMALAAPEERRLDLRAPYALLRELWVRGWGYRLWLLGSGALVVGLGVFGVLAWVAPDGLHLTRLATRVGRGLAAVWLLPLGVAAVQAAWAFAPKLSRFRTAPLLACGAMVGVYAAHGFMPGLSEHFSPREVYEVYNQLSGGKEPLAQHKLAGRSASYYAKGEVSEIKQRNELARWLAEEERRWAVFPGEELGEVNAAFRRKSKRHLFIPSADNARITLASNNAVQGVENVNPLARAVVSTPPTLQHPLQARYQDRVELLGYDLKLPGGDSVGQGESFQISWAFKALRRGIGQYEVFVHVDGPGKRIHGDHDPVDGKYPVKVWDRGDIVLDSHEIKVPASARPGTYTIYVGFYRGNSRLKVVEGKKDGANRVRAGTIRIR